MAKNKGRIENLRRLDTDTAREIGKIGGRVCAERKRERKLMSQIYGAALADEYDVMIKGELVKLSGEEFFKAVVRDVLMRSDAASVSMLKEIREATEGNKLALEADVNVVDVAASLPWEDRMKMASEWLASKTSN